MLPKKASLVGTSDISMGPSLVTKGRSGPNLTTSWSNHSEKGSEGETKAEARGERRDRDTRNRGQSTHEKNGKKRGAETNPPRGKKNDKMAQWLRNQNQEPGTVLAGVCARRRVGIIAAQRWRTLKFQHLISVPTSFCSWFAAHWWLAVVDCSSYVSSVSSSRAKTFYQVSMLYAASDVAPHLVKVLDVRFCYRRCSTKC